MFKNPHLPTMNQILTMADDATTTTDAAAAGPPSLLDLTTQIVASNIEKYPAGLWGNLSESQWENVLRARVAQKKAVPLKNDPSSSYFPPLPRKKSFKRGGNNAVSRGENCRRSGDFAESTGKPIAPLPALSAKHLSQIEQHPRNTHLAHSAVADELWKDILNYKFRQNGMNRPSSLSVPYTVVEKRLGECVAVLREICVEGQPKESIGFAEFVERKRTVEKNDKQEQTAAVDRLFNESESDLDDELQEMVDEEEDLKLEYQKYMANLADQNFERIKRTCYTLSESPMDVQLLADTKIGKTVSKAVKTLTKLKRMREEGDDDETAATPVKKGEEDRIEIREMLWKRAVAEWSNYLMMIVIISQAKQQQQRAWRSSREAPVELTPLELLQQLLDDWKEMASDNGVEIRSDNPSVASAAAASTNTAALSPPKKKRRMETTNQNNDDSSNKYNNIRVTTCGRDKHISPDQHCIDMNLLRNSPDWRSLYVSLTNRELELRKSHGEKVRATREHLERDRPKIGKVILKRAVGRVRGGDVGGVGSSLQRNDGDNSGEGTSLSSSQIPTKMAVGGGEKTTLATLAAERKIARQEAILNKSKGLRAIQKQRSITGGAGSSKVAQIRQTSKVAAKWGKSSFGDSVASAAGSKSGVRKVGMQKEEKQVQLSLQNGKTMKLPSASNALKSTGKFSSLQQKMAAKSRGLKKRKH